MLCSSKQNRFSGSGAGDEGIHRLEKGFAALNGPAGGEGVEEGGEEGKGGWLGGGKVGYSGGRRDAVDWTKEKEFLFPKGRTTTNSGRGEYSAFRKSIQKNEAALVDGEKERVEEGGWEGKKQERGAGGSRRGLPRPGDSKKRGIKGDSNQLKNLPGHGINAHGYVASCLYHSAPFRPRMEESHSCWLRTAHV